MYYHSTSRQWTTWITALLMITTGVHAADKLQTEPGLETYTVEARTEDNQFSVYLPTAYGKEGPLPLVFFGHPNGGSATKEMNQWKDRAEKFPFIAVTLDLRSSRHSKHIPEDVDYLEEVIERVTDSLEYDEDWVVYTAHSGGGYAGWMIIAEEYDKVFTAMCYRSANCPERVDLASRWKRQPIYMFWSDNDAPLTGKQNPALAKYLEEDFKAKELKTEEIPGGGHKSQPEKFIAWLQEITSK